MVNGSLRVKRRNDQVASFERNIQKFWTLVFLSISNLGYLTAVAYKYLEIEWCSRRDIHLKNQTTTLLIPWILKTPRNAVSETRLNYNVAPPPAERSTHDQPSLVV